MRGALAALALVALASSGGCLDYEESIVIDAAGHGLIRLTVTPRDQPTRELATAVVGSLARAARDRLAAKPDVEAVSVEPLAIAVTVRRFEELPDVLAALRAGAPEDRRDDLEIVRVGPDSVAITRRLGGCEHAARDGEGEADTCCLSSLSTAPATGSIALSIEAGGEIRRETGPLAGPFDARFVVNPSGGAARVRPWALAVTLGGLAAIALEGLRRGLTSAPSASRERDTRREPETA